MSRKYTVVATRPGELVSLVQFGVETIPGDPPEERQVKLAEAYITRRGGDYVLVDRADGAAMPGWPPSAVDALIQYRASRVQGVVPPVDPTDG